MRDLDKEFASWTSAMKAKRGGKEPKTLWEEFSMLGEVCVRCKCQQLVPLNTGCCLGHSVTMHVRWECRTAGICRQLLQRAGKSTDSVHVLGLMHAGVRGFPGGCSGRNRRHQGIIFHIISQYQQGQQW